LRILLVSNAPWSGTGYGTQIAQLAKQLRKQHEVAIFANYGLSGAKTQWDGITVYPGAISPSGDDLLHPHADDWKADVVLILYDAFAMNGSIQRQMKQLVMIWQPVDCEPFGKADLEQFTASGSQPVAMSRFGERMMRDAGLDPLYAPHGIDTQHTFVPAEEILYPASTSSLGRRDAKELLRKDNGLPEDAFIIGMNVHNKDPERKAVFEQMAAFSLLHARHPDTLLLVHSMPHPVMSGINLLAMAEHLGIAGAVHWANPYDLLAGNYTPGDMARWYAQLDLYSGASRGEGFGLPLIEAQACAVPVVTTCASAMAELAGPGWAVNGQPHWVRGNSSTWTTPDIGSLMAVYEEAYDGGAARRSENARMFGLGYDADYVYAKYWHPLWETISHRLADWLPRDSNRAGWSLVK
jgi:glycosyltransferase involved in cell wall biosynthesis